MNAALFLRGKATALRILGIGVAAAAALLIPGCSQSMADALPVVASSSVPSIRGSGTVVERQVELGDFSDVEVYSSFHVEVVLSDISKVVVSADDNVIDRVEISNSGQTLRLGLHPGSYTNATLRARVYLPELRGLSLAEATNVTISGTRSQSSMDLKLSGASRLSGSLQASEVELSVAEASAATLIGNADALKLQTSGASKAHLAELAVGRASVNMREASSATVNVKGDLDADLSSASALRYLGTPKLERVFTRDASSVLPR